MWKCLTIACLLALAMNVSPAPAAEPAKLDLYLLVGQSNMAGRGKPEPQDKVVNPHVFALSQADAWVPAVDPLHFDKPKAVGVGPGRTFGIAVAAASGHDVGLVPCAVGGTSINQWKKGGKLYTEAVRRARLAMAHGEFRGILWHQGETDVDHKMPLAEYFPKLAALIADFRADLNAPELPFILGQIGPFHQKLAGGTDDFNAKLAEFADTQQHCTCVHSDGLKDIGDSTHFNADSQHEMGHRYAQAFAELSAAASKP